MKKIEDLIRQEKDCKRPKIRSAKWWLLFPFSIISLSTISCGDPVTADAAKIEQDKIQREFDSVNASLKKSETTVDAMTSHIKKQLDSLKMMEEDTSVKNNEPNAEYGTKQK